MITTSIEEREIGMTRVKTDSHLIVGPPSRSGYRVVTCCKTCRTYLIYPCTNARQEQGGHLYGLYYWCEYDRIGAEPRSIAYDSWQDAFYALERQPVDLD